jgi:hypothetical protein
VVDSYTDDVFASDLIAKLSLDTSVVPHYSWSQGFLRYKNRIWVGSYNTLQLKLIAAMHDSTIWGGGTLECESLIKG